MLDYKLSRSRIIQGTKPFRLRGLEEVGVHDVPLLPATSDGLEGFGHLIHDFSEADVTIVTWPAAGWRPILPNTGKSGGIAEGVFEMAWHGDTLQTENHAVGGSYITGWASDPIAASQEGPRSGGDHIYTFEANYHPDGGQVFYPMTRSPFVALLAKATDDIRPEHFKAFYFDGSCGVHVDPGVWHQPVFPLGQNLNFRDKQGKVHACVGCNFVEEFGVYLKVPLRAQP